MLRVLDIKTGGINITWYNGSETSIQTFSLTVNYGSSSQVIPLNESYYLFTVPNSAPSCEVYNFSVTATYVGATYTGAGCSLPSPVLSIMLPPLPDIDHVESSLSFLLTKKPNGSVVLQVLLSVS